MKKLSNITRNNYWSESIRPFIVAEMSGNHNQSIDRALKIVDSAAENGANAIKLQTYTADTMTLDVFDKDFIISDTNSIWSNEKLYDLYQKAHTPWDWHEPIMKRAKQKGLICFSSPFDESAVDFLESLDVPAYKIASFECIDLPLISKVAKTGKPLIISTGMASLTEISEAVETARKDGCNDLTLLKCTSTYPASPENTNIKSIPHMKELFNCKIGLSDHTMGIGVSIAAVTLGAVLIEKHFTLDRADGGIDSTFSIEPSELKNLVTESERAWQSIGKIHYGPTEVEEKNRNLRRSIYIIQDLVAGTILDKNNIKTIRPGYGLPPKYYDLILGKKINKDVKKGSPLTWKLVD